MNVEGGATVPYDLPMETDDHRRAAAAAYNRCWELLERDQRNDDEDDELLTSAFASKYHWARAGGREELVTSDWMVSRAAGAVGEPALAVRFALCANDAAQEPRTSDWLVASTAEGLARAYAAAGDVERSMVWRTVAERLVERIADEDDRAIIASQVATLPEPGS